MVGRTKSDLNAVVVPMLQISSSASKPSVLPSLWLNYKQNSATLASRSTLKSDQIINEILLAEFHWGQSGIPRWLTMQPKAAMPSSRTAGSHLIMLPSLTFWLLIFGGYRLHAANFVSYLSDLCLWSTYQWPQSFQHRRTFPQLSVWHSFSRL